MRPRAQQSERPFRFVSEVQLAVCREFGVSELAMLSRRRERKVAVARMVAVYLTRQTTKLSTPQIGRQFGGLDHSSVIHAIRRVEELATADPDLGDRVVALSKRFYGA